MSELESTKRVQKQTDKQQCDESLQQKQQANEQKAISSKKLSRYYMYLLQLTLIKFINKQHPHLGKLCLSTTILKLLIEFQSILQNIWTNSCPDKLSKGILSTAVFKWLCEKSKNNDVLYSDWCLLLILFMGRNCFYKEDEFEYYSDEIVISLFEHRHNLNHEHFMKIQNTICNSVDSIEDFMIHKKLEVRYCELFFSFISNAVKILIKMQYAPKQLISSIQETTSVDRKTYKYQYLFKNYQIQALEKIVEEEEKNDHDNINNKYWYKYFVLVFYNQIVQWINDHDSSDIEHLKNILGKPSIVSYLNENSSHVTNENQVNDENCLSRPTFDNLKGVQKPQEVLKIVKGAYQNWASVVKHASNNNDEILNTNVKSDDNQLPPRLGDRKSELNFKDTNIKDDIHPSLQPVVIKAALSTLSLHLADISTTKTRSSRHRTKSIQYNSYGMPTRPASTSALPPASSLIVTSLSHHSFSDSSLNRKPRFPSTKKREIIKDSSEEWPRSEYPSTALVEKETISWPDMPKYSIKNAVFNGRKYSVINTCPLDSGLFVLYYAYISYSDEFRALFDRETKLIYSNLRKTFQLVGSDGWDIARLYWLNIHKRLNSSVVNSNNQYNLFGTVDENVFGYVRTMQEYENSSNCLCEDCPRRTRTLISTDIALNKENNAFSNTLPHFETAEAILCGTPISEEEPMNYSGDYILDEKFPLHNPETNVDEIRPYWCCNSLRERSKNTFRERPPILIINIAVGGTKMKELPVIFNVGLDTYKLFACICGRDDHFTATIKKEHLYYKYDDLHSKGIYIYDGTDTVETAVYYLLV
ncbi:unnamed protein product [Didymodactylos carnosus]|uniref:Uncharacterized protein n=1 Tax=Didymodactylos carnosus TaxID=1234261 RepID=A0A814RF25_9BILA|nr:unnamed protein product [Didymodactylos carnosus]CAF1133080.1 unnamed protein product [Didymodactylos carnosus]CAF3543652.1 unnamed protein product [Didymodactylos carnosus]CAF3896900.1 unnamed protein product [Didymodactylos carnosus]